MELGGVNDVMLRKRGLRILGIWEKADVEFLRPNGKVDFRGPPRPDQ